MTYIPKPKLHHPSLTRNAAGYTRRDYEGKISTLCAGCGHDSISAAIIQSCAGRRVTAAREPVDRRRAAGQAARRAEARPAAERRCCRNRPCRPEG